jgi:hypothetical protein
VPARRATRLIPTRLGGHLYAAATERVGLKLAAAFFAVVLWVVAGAEEPTEARVPVTFAPLHDTALVLERPMPVLRAVVAGRRRELLKLYRSPPVLRYTFLGDLPDTVHLLLRPTDIDLPTGVVARVLDVRPREALLHFVSRDPRRDSLLRAVVESVTKAPAVSPVQRQRVAGAIAPALPDSVPADTTAPDTLAPPAHVAPPDTLAAHVDSARRRADSLQAPRADSARRPPPGR